MKDLKEIRGDIDRIDEEIVRLYEERMALTAEVAEYKIVTGKQVFDREREQSKLDTLSSKAGSDFTAAGVRELFEQIMTMSRKKQYQLLTEHGIRTDVGFVQDEDSDDSQARIVFQGVEGAYSQQAMREYFGADCNGRPVPTWKDAMEAIKNQEADYAVLPIENSSAGIVSENYDLLVEYDNYIVGEQIIRIDHALLGLPDADMSDISCVFSHPQALMQCGEYLFSHPDWEKISVKNTALAAKKVKEDGLRSQAAIASTLTADIYGLKILDQGIQDNKNNSTRFIIVSGRPVYHKESKHISLCFEIADKSGSLYHTLSHFIYNGLNMINIQSRPLKDRNWEYRFFVDLEGRLDDTAVHNALRGLEEETVSLRILGTY